MCRDVHDLKSERPRERRQAKGSGHVGQNSRPYFFTRRRRVKDTAGAAHKPDSVPGAEAPGTVICLAPRLPAGSSGRPAPGTGDPMGGTFGLTASPKAGGGYFLWHFPSASVWQCPSRVNHGTPCPAESGLSSPSSLTDSGATVSSTPAVILIPYCSSFL